MASSLLRNFCTIGSRRSGKRERISTCMSLPVGGPTSGSRGSTQTPARCAERRRTWAAIGYATAGVVAATAGALFYVSRRRMIERPVRTAADLPAGKLSVLPSVTPDAIGAAATWAF